MRENAAAHKGPLAHSVTHHASRITHHASLMTLLLREQHVTELLNIETAIAAVEEVLRDQAEGEATNRPRYRVAVPTSHLHVMAAADHRLPVAGLKTYTVSPNGAPSLVLLYDAEYGD